MKLKEISEAVLVCGECQSRIAGRDLLCGEAADEPLDTPLFLSDFIDPSSAWRTASLVRKLAGSGLSNRLLAAMEADPPGEFEEWAVDLRCPECSAKIDSSFPIRCAVATD